MSANWGELWDQTEVIGVHTQKGIDFLEKVGTFVKERAAIEEEYAAKLKGLVKRNLSKKKEDTEAAKNYTTLRAFNMILEEIDSLAKQHERIADRMKQELLPFVATKAANHRLARKQSLADLSAINNQLALVKENMFRQQKAYGKAFKEAEAAWLKYNKAEKNMEISRLDLEKAKTNAKSRNMMSEEAKQGYAHTLQMANDAQNRHFEQQLPAVLDKFRSLDDERIRDTRAALEMAINTEKEVMTVINRCHQDMASAIEVIDPAADTSTLVEQFRTGYPHPPLHVFEDLGSPENVINGGGDTIDGQSATLKRGLLGNGNRKDGKSVARKQSMHQKLFGGSDNKGKDGGDYAALPPQQRVRKIQAKLNELEQDLNKNIQAREGVIRMQQVYQQNPKMGDASKCDGQVASYSKDIDMITQQIQRFRMLLDDAMAHTAPPIGGSDTPPSSRSESGASSHAPPRPQPPLNGQRASYSEESVSSEGSRMNSDRRDEVYEECQMPVLGTCTAVFAFEGGNTEGTIVMGEGQEFLLVERDEGDGWTRVRSMDGRTEGFVPSSYLKCKWYPTE